MTTHRKCTFRTFWLGYKDWLRERCAKRLPDVLAEVKNEHGRFFVLKLSLMLVLLLFLLLFLVHAASTLATQGHRAGVTSQQVMVFSQAVAYLVVFGALGAWIATQVFKAQRFCHEMCERGHRILEASAR